MYIRTGARAIPTYLSKFKKKLKMLLSTYVLHEDYVSKFYEMLIEIQDMKIYLYWVISRVNRPRGRR